MLATRLQGGQQTPLEEGEVRLQMRHRRAPSRENASADVPRRPNSPCSSPGDDAPRRTQAKRQGVLSDKVRATRFAGRLDDVLSRFCATPSDPLTKHGWSADNGRVGLQSGGPGPTLFTLAFQSQSI